MCLVVLKIVLQTVPDSIRAPTVAHRLICSPRALLLCTLLGTTLALAGGCGSGQPRRSADAEDESEPKQSAPAAQKPQQSKARRWTESAAHEAFRAANPEYNGQGQFAIQDGRIVAADLARTGVSDLTPLAGSPLVELFLEETSVSDLSPLTDAKLRKLYLSKTPISDLSPLRGSPLVELNLLGTQVKDLTPLGKSPLQMLWLNDTPVSDIGPLRGVPLVSLTLHNTQVKDLSPLAGSGLQRLHIAGTPVTDLTPIKDLILTRLVFTPDRIRQGMDHAREMKSLTEIGTTLEGRMPPPQFWASYDQ